VNTGQPLSFNPYLFLLIRFLSYPIRSPSYLRYPYSSVYLFRWFLSAFLLIDYYFSLGYAHCPTRCPTLADSLLLLRLLIVHAALRSFHSSDRSLLFMPDTLTYPSRCLAQLPCYTSQYDSSWTLTQSDSALTVEYIRPSSLSVFPQFDLFVNTPLYSLPLSL